MLYWTRKEAVEKEQELHDLMPFLGGRGEKGESEVNDDCDILKTNDGTMVMLIKAEVADWAREPCLAEENASSPLGCMLSTPFEHKTEPLSHSPLLLGVSRGYCSGQRGWAKCPLWARAFNIKVYFLFTAFSWPRWPRAEWSGNHVLKMESTTLGTELSAKRSNCPGWLPIPDSNTRNTLGHLVKAA